MYNPQELHIFNKELLNDHMTKNDIANREESNECLKKLKSKLSIEILFIINY